MNEDYDSSSEFPMGDEFISSHEISRILRVGRRKRPVSDKFQNLTSIEGDNNPDEMLAGSLAIVAFFIILIIAFAKYYCNREKKEVKIVPTENNEDDNDENKFENIYLKDLEDSSVYATKIKQVHQQKKLNYNNLGSNVDEEIRQDDLTMIVSDESIVIQEKS